MPWCGWGFRVFAAERNAARFLLCRCAVGQVVLCFLLQCVGIPALPERGVSLVAKMVSQKPVVGFPAVPERYDLRLLPQRLV